MQTTRSSTRCKRYTSERKHLCLNNSSSKAEDVSAYTLAAWVTEIAVKRKSGCRKPRYRRLRDIERSRYVSLRFALGEPLQRFLPWCRVSAVGRPNFTPLVLA